MSDNQLVDIAEEVEKCGIQFVASILRDKLPAQLNDEKYFVLKLSQQEKLFKIEENIWNCFEPAYTTLHIVEAMKKVPDLAQMVPDIPNWVIMSMARMAQLLGSPRSEERRVGKECLS